MTNFSLNLTAFDQAAAAGNFGPIVSLGEVTAGGSRLDGYDSRARQALATAAGYAVNYLALPHDKLGRSGPVCPYTPAAISANSFFLAVADASCANRKSIGEAAAVMEKIFPLLASPAPEVEPEKSSKILTCLLLLFPHLQDEAKKLFLDVQGKTKLSFMTKGYLIGAFFPGCPVPGLHNSAFRPFDMPVPSIAVRHMTEYDVPFAAAEDDYVQAYLAQFGAAGAARYESFRARCPHRAPV
ncbi:MAG: hypothetical protein JO256_03085 [Alphaproteobacteria bacterium]|nr:hypothetical protein [Alphaproteobacteria bacterium]